MHETSMPENIIDTPQIYDGAVTIDKLDPAIGTDWLAALEAAVRDSTRMQVATIAVDCTHSATVPILTIPAGSLLTDIVAVTTVGINGSGTISIGDISAVDNILPAASINNTIGTVVGDDPAVRGTNLWVPGVFNGGSLSAGSQTKTPVVIGSGTQTKDAATPDFSVTAWPAVTTPDNWTVTQGTLTPATLTTYGHPRKMFYAADTIINATVVKGTNTAGTVTVYLFYERGIMP